MDKKKYGLVDIYGGFGNQLSQYSIANYLENRGLKIKINVHWYSNEHKFPRDLIFNPEFYDFKTANKKDLRLFQILDNTKNNKFYFKNPSEILKISDFKLFNRFIGYWQDLIYLENSKYFLTSKLKNNKNIKNGLNFVPDDNSVMIHVRRGDYVSTKKFIDISYFENAINKIKNRVKKPKFNVFTDDKEWVESQSIFNDVENIFHSSSSKKDTILTFSEMLKHNHFIISNSTFSYLAAYFKFNENSTIVIPEPWMPNSKRLYNLYDKQWIKIKSN